MRSEAQSLALARDTVRFEAVPARIALRLFESCRSAGWAGYDPYDALNSGVFRMLPLQRLKLARLVFTQGMKRSPINLRPLLAVPTGQNPKGVALFLASAVRLRKLDLVDGAAVSELAQTLLGLADADDEYAGWGYNFDWQTRGILIPRGTRNIICTTFAANAALDAFEVSRDDRLREVAVKAARFIRDHLCVETEDEAFLSYTALAPSQVHNANLLGAALLARVGRQINDATMLDLAFRAARSTTRRQDPCGSWAYGESASQKWVDNFHTGFNLCALSDIGRYGASTEFDENLRRGFEFFRQHFFEEAGTPKYYHDRTYPIDIHSAAQSMVTLVALKDLGEGTLELADRVFCWTLRNMWDEDRSYFYFQKHRLWTIRVPYMRWSQAWMLLALAMLAKGRTT